MKAEVFVNASKQIILTLAPETVEEEWEIRALAETTSQVHTFSSKGFQYMDPTVEFVIQRKDY